MFSICVIGMQHCAKFLLHTCPAFRCTDSDIILIILFLRVSSSDFRVRFSVHVYIVVDLPLPDTPIRAFEVKPNNWRADTGAVHHSCTSGETALQVSIASSLRRCCSSCVASYEASYAATVQLTLACDLKILPEHKYM